MPKTYVKSVNVEYQILTENVDETSRTEERRRKFQIDFIVQFLCPVLCPVFMWSDFHLFLCPLCSRLKQIYTFFFFFLSSISTTSKEREQFYETLFTLKLMFMKQIRSFGQTLKQVSGQAFFYCPALASNKFESHC